MEPLSAIASASALAFAAIKAARALSGLRDCYEKAGPVLASINSECTALHIALTQLQRLALSGLFFERLTSQPHFGDSLDLVLLSSVQTFSALDEEIRIMTQSLNQKQNLFQRLKYVWNEEAMREILQQLRCQQNTINLLLTAMQTYGYQF